MKNSLWLCIYLFSFLLHANFATAQLGNKNMYSLANLDQHGENYSALWGYKAPDGREYAILGCYDGTAFIDITDPQNIHEVDFVNSTSVGNYFNLWREMKIYSHYAYIVSEVRNSGVQIVDLQYLPDSVRYVQKYVPADHSYSHSISQSGPYLYLNGSNSSFGQGTVVLDLTNDPENPVKRGGFNLDYIHDCRVVDDTIYSADIYGGKVSIIDATNKNSLYRITQFTNLPNAGPHNTALTPDKKYLLVTDEIGSAPYRLKIWDIDDIGNITFMSAWQPTGITTSIVHNVEAYGQHALVAHYTAGVRLVNISNPAVPVETAYYDTYPAHNNEEYIGCWAVYMFPSGKIIASDMVTGLHVLKTTFNVSVAIEGLYNSAANRQNRRDSVTVLLKNTSPPYATVDSSRSIIDSISLTAQMKFDYAPAGNYYIVVKHRNSIQTWSKNGGENFDPMTADSYNFTSSTSQAYGNNMTAADNSPVIFALYSGDVNQDEVIDGSDVLLIGNDAFNYMTGYIATDLNGDETADGTDQSIADNNAYNYVGVARP
ncbi:MAG: choice-of-anchor B family protein [Ignavibacteria bacterium]|nr:choice-of-anchor B family protein [Ignavibacteria bacterium]